MRFTIGEEVRIHGLRDRGLLGKIVSLSPLRAKVTEPDKVFQGTETTVGIRKLKPKTGPLKKAI